METSQSYNKISFFYQNRRPRINKEKIQKWLEKVCLQENYTIVDLNYTFCSDESLLEINIQHLNHDYYTDIITFDLSDVSREIEGDIYISVDRVRENAKNLKAGFEHEILRVIVHGLLHLMGYKDKTVSEAKTMREKEEESLMLY
jgi:probable rRNA maturation factor